MRNIAVSVILVLIFTIPCLAGKIISDPNTSASSSTIKQISSDPRLAQKVTYKSGYKRLHTIADELSQMTGVTIRAGNNKQDWHIRDIPLIVYVKDMPLGKLLQRISECAHVRLVVEKVANAKDEKPAYKLYRNRTKEDDITLQLDARAEANRKKPSGHGMF